MTTLKAKDFKMRDELEAKVRNLMGLTPEMKPDYQISGTQVELGALHLSKSTIFWGIRCVELDEKPPNKKAKTVDRGEVKAFGINGNLKKIK